MKENQVESNYFSLDQALALSSIPVRKANPHFELIRLLGDRTDMDDLFSPTLDLLSQWPIRCSPESFRWLMQQSSFSFHVWPLDTRIDFALSLGTRGMQPDWPALIHLVLADQKINSHVCHFKSQNGRTFFLQAAYSLGEHYGEASRCYDRYADGKSTTNQNSFSWEDKREYLRLKNRLRFISQLVTSGSDLHHQAKVPFSISLWGQTIIHERLETPFIAVIAATSSSLRYFPWLLTPEDHFNALTTFHHKVHTAIHLFLSTLLAAGVNLEEYGRNEYAMHTNPDYEIGKTYASYQYKKVELGFEVRETTHRLVDFEYGAKVDDWKLWFVDYEVHDLWFWRQFWRGIERWVGWMPGEWVDEDDEDEDGVLDYPKQCY